MSERINVIVGPAFQELHTHLAGYGNSKGERFKVLASVGAVIENSGIEMPMLGIEQTGPLESDWNGRVNIRLSDAYPELLSKLHSSDLSKAKRLKLLANLGLLAMRGECPSPGPRSAQHSEQKLDDKRSSKSEIDRLGLAAGLFDEGDTTWL
ncbi:hypothetical protein [Hydrocarboniclastica marina]|uniref:Uncharacterized protein n=1 Tax=Hydrocarboniclastica marina TaxID=2259620 RepID=A0A4P7XNR0_9ALTE|nr:hypothetical protein [Hydrocarboniclastica marina]QCF28087.1 hypothetical protein soil367_18615 [Hydrocarboniclastica marina]